MQLAHGLDFVGGALPPPWSTVAVLIPVEIAEAAGRVFPHAAGHRAAPHPVLTQRVFQRFASSAATVVAGAQSVGYGRAVAAGNGADTGHGPNFSSAIPGNRGG